MELVFLSEGKSVEIAQPRKDILQSTLLYSIYVLQYVNVPGLWLWNMLIINLESLNTK